MPAYRNLIARLERLERSARAVPPTSESAVNLSLLVTMTRCEAEAHPHGMILRLCARARGNAAKAHTLIQSSRSLLDRGARLVGRFPAA